MITQQEAMNFINLNAFKNKYAQALIFTLAEALVEGQSFGFFLQSEQNELIDRLKSTLSEDFSLTEGIHSSSGFLFSLSRLDKTKVQKKDGCCGFCS